MAILASVGGGLFGVFAAFVSLLLGAGPFTALLIWVGSGFCALLLICLLTHLPQRSGRTAPGSIA